MWKILTRTNNTLEGDFINRPPEPSVFELIFALANSLRITPSKLAKHIDKERTLRYAEAFWKALIKEATKETDKAKRTLNKNNVKTK